MSKLFKLAKNPLSNNYEPAAYVYNHFGEGVHGVWFQDGSIYNPAVVPIKFQEV